MLKTGSVLRFGMPTSIWVVLCLVSAVVSADSITVAGVSYRDVLVYQSPSIYYVKLPEEGRVLSIPTAQIDPLTVEINDDPYYRDELKEKYERARLRVLGPANNEQRTPLDPAFLVQQKSKSQDIGQLLGPRGSGEPLGISAAALKSQLRGAGLTFRQGKSLDGEEATIGASRDKRLEVQIIGPPSDVTGVVVKIRGKAQQTEALTKKLIAMVPLMQAVAPWIGGWMEQNIFAILGGGQMQNTQDGVLSYVVIKSSGAGITIVITIMAA